MRDTYVKIVGEPFLGRAWEWRRERDAWHRAWGRYAIGKGGSYGIGSFGIILNGPWVGFAGDTFLGWIPDAEAAVRAHRKDHPEDTILEPAASWTLPAGLERITQAEYELIYAQWKVEEERRAAAKAGGG